MKNTISALGRKGLFVLCAIALVMAAGLALAGCPTDGDPGSSFVPVTGITNTPQIAIQGVELELSATVVPSNATHQTITWSGGDVTDGKFKATSAGTKTVTATIANGASETSPYTKTFTITVYGTSSTITQAQGAWTKPYRDTGYTLIMTINSYTWKIEVDTGGGNKFTKYTGIIVQADGTNYIAQINSELMDYDGQMHTMYYYDMGTYSIDTSKTPNEFTINSTDPNSTAMGTWKKQSS
jgi:hypothetical protein